ncbi:MAG TPA: hypothetical protein VK856_16375 [Anaerolineaceae bacterium]|nr:hypothetical protein [Anaerolineaceae bacterium]
MPKLLAILFTLLLIGTLSGCNLPDSNSSNPDDLATQVANLLTTTPLLPSPQIEEPTLENTPEPVEPTDELPTETIVTVIENTITPTNVTFELPSSQPFWSDPFDDGTRFGINPEGYDDGQTRIIISEGNMELTSITGSGWRGWRLTSQKPSNYFLEADFITQECSGSDQYGLVVQSPDFSSGFGYYFGLTCDGRFAFQKWEDGGLANLQSWNADPNINIGSDQANTIGIHKSGDQYNLYVNNVRIANIVDEKFSEPGYFGPFIAGVNTANFTVIIPNISYWNLP